MIKTLALIKRRPDVDRETFRDHYENVHVPLALPILEGLLRYVRYHVESTLMGQPDFNLMTAFGYRDKGATDEVFARLASDAGAAILEDELSFMDKSANRAFAVSERVWQPGEEGDTHLFVLVSRPEGMSRFDASSNLVADHWPRLLGQIVDPHFALLRDGFPMQGEVAAYNNVMQIGASLYSGLEAWAKSLEVEGYRVDAVATRRFETSLET